MFSGNDPIVDKVVPPQASQNNLWFQEDGNNAVKSDSVISYVLPYS
jgi:hypothetical protein